MENIQEVIDKTTRLFKKAHLDYGQTKYVLKKVRQNLGLKPKRRPTGTVKRLQNADLVKFLETAYKINPRIGLMLHTLYEGGFRVSEFINLKPDDLMVDEIKVVVRSGKGDKRREVPITSGLMNVLNIYLNRRTVGYLFESNRSDKYSSRRIQQLVKEAGIEAGISMKVTPHMLRHTRATYLLENGISKNLLQGFLGHDSPLTTEIYVKTAQVPLERVFREKIDKKLP